MVDRTAIQPDMEVLGSDGILVGRVGNLEGAALRLSGPATPDGRRHLVPLSMIARIDRQVHLSVPAGTISESNAGTSDAAVAGAPISSLSAGAALGAAAASAPAGGVSAAPTPHAAAGGTGGDGTAGLPPIRNPAVDGARPRSNYYLPWVLGGLLLLLILFVGLRSCDTDDDDRDVRDPRPRTEEVRRDPGELRARGVRYAEGTIAHDLDRFLASGEPAPRTLSFDRLNFDTGSASIREGDIADLDQIAQILNAYPRTRIAIIGYTDAVGGRRSNERLGEERAEAVVEGLAVRGIDRDRLEARSGGEQEPRRDNDDSQGRSENRRTEMIVLSR